GQGMVSCVKAWHVSKPQLVVMHGDPTDNNATLFATGYNSVLDPLFSSHKNINAALIPNDETGAPIITYLKTHGVKPDTFPTTGQDATLTGLQAVLSGYQCGTAYKAVYKEAQAAVALAMYLRASKTP